MPKEKKLVTNKASGRLISASSEEIDATQPLLKILDKQNHKFSPQNPFSFQVYNDWSKFVDKP